MRFYTPYELDEFVSSGEAATFSAHEAATGKAVMLHLVAAHPAKVETPSLLELARLRAQSRPADVIEVAEFDASPYVVTPPIERFTTLRAWLSGTPDAPSVPPSQPKPEPAPEQPEASRFSLMFQTPQDPEPEAPVQEPGAFTKLFESPLASAPMDVDAEHAPVDIPKARPFQAAGEFTQLFGRGPTGESAAEPLPEADAGLGSIFVGKMNKPAVPLPAFGAGEYTAVIKGATPPTGNQPAPASPHVVPIAIPARKFDRKRSYVPLILIVSLAVVLIALWLVLAR